MATVNEVIKYAKSFVGKNYSGMVSAGMKSGNSGLWCADFVVFILNKKGVSAPNTSSSQYFKSLSNYHSKSGYTPKVGDVFILTYSSSSGHVGFVTGVNGSKISTCEGNSSGGKVSLGSYAISNSKLVGFWTPTYSGGEDTEGSSSELAGVSTVKTEGADGAAKKYVSIADNVSEFKYELFIQKGDNIYQPSTVEGISLQQTLSSSPAKLSFKVLKDDILNFSEGSTVVFRINKKGVFYGYVFSKKRSSGDEISVVAYDQTRYFKNQDTYIYTNKTASDFIKMVLSDYKLRIGNIADTGFLIEKRIEDNKSLWDMFQSALEVTTQNTGKSYVIYDNFGYIDLRALNSSEMKSNLLIDEDSYDSDYTSSIDSDTYNRIVLYKDDKDTNIRSKYVYQDGATISAWGILQKTEKLDDDESPDTKGKSMLNSYNSVTRKLSVTTIGNYNIRPGMSVFVNLNLGDIIQNDYMTVIDVNHNFEEDNYSMQLTLKGGLINDE